MIGGEVDERTALPGRQAGVMLGRSILTGRQQVEHDDGLQPVLPAEGRNIINPHRPRFKPSQFTGDGLQARGFKDPVAEGGLVQVFTPAVPAANHQVVQTGEGVGLKIRF